VLIWQFIKAWQFISLSGLSSCFSQNHCNHGNYCAWTAEMCVSHFSLFLPISHNYTLLSVQKVLTSTAARTPHASRVHPETCWGRVYTPKKVDRRHSYRRAAVGKGRGVKGQPERYWSNIWGRMCYTWSTQLLEPCIYPIYGQTKVVIAEWRLTCRLSSPYSEST
jgi:hypothetical protein